MDSDNKLIRNVTMKDLSSSVDFLFEIIDDWNQKYGDELGKIDKQLFNTVTGKTKIEEVLVNYDHFLDRSDVQEKEVLIRSIWASGICISPSISGLDLIFNYTKYFSDVYDVLRDEYKLSKV